MRRGRTMVVSGGLAVAASIACARSALAADYGALGPETAAESDIPSGTGGAPSGKLLVPASAGPHPLVVAIHGWSAGADNQLGWAEHFASWGFVVVVPDLPSPFSPDTATNKKIVIDLVRAYSDPSFASPASGKVDATRIGLEGHSAGGLAAAVAASELAPRATVLFDPVDNGGVGKTAYASLCTPVMALFAAPGSCNQNGGWAAFKNATLGPLVVADVVGATHCDGENAPRSLCGPFCGGGASPARQTVHARYATAFFLAHLKGDAAAAATLSAGALAADADLAQTFARTTAQPSCVAGDAGASSDASAPAKERDAALGQAGDDDASAPPGAATRDDGGTAAAGGSADGDDGGGCAIGNGATTGTAAAAAALALLARLRRRARPRSSDRDNSSRS